MRDRKNTFRHESLQDRKSVQKLLAALMDGVDKGKLVFADEDDRIKMTPEGLLRVKLTASQEENRNRVDLRLTWERVGKDTNLKKALSVSSK